MLGIEIITKIKGKSFEDLGRSEIAEIILPDSAILPEGSDRFSASALDKFLNYSIDYPPELEKIRSEVLAEIYINVPGQKAKEIDVEFLKRYSKALLK